MIQSKTDFLFFSGGTDIELEGNWLKYQNIAMSTVLD